MRIRTSRQTLDGRWIEETDLGFFLPFQLEYDWELIYKSHYINGWDNTIRLYSENKHMQMQINYHYDEHKDMPSAIWNNIKNLEDDKVLLKDYIWTQTNP